MTSEASGPPEGRAAGRCELSNLGAVLWKSIMCPEPLPTYIGAGIEFGSSEEWRMFLSAEPGSQLSTLPQSPECSNYMCVPMSSL